MSHHGQLDKAKIKQSFAAAAGNYDAVAALQRQVGLDLLKKFPLQVEAGLVMDLGAGTGFLTRALAVTEHQSLCGCGAVTVSQCFAAANLFEFGLAVV